MNPRFPLRSIVFLCAALLVALGCGCAATPVRPWERATLSSYSMRVDRDAPAAAMAEHVWFSREASSGGRGVGGSGCGCN